MRWLLEIRVGGVIDEGDIVLAFKSAVDTALVEWSHLVRSETIRNGQRYRYGGKYLVPIDQAEEITQSEIERSGQRASGPRELETACTECRGDLPRVVPLVVFVGADGKVSGVQRRTSREQIGDDMVASAKEAVARAPFRPAHAKGRAVADWVLVDVRVILGK